MLLDFLRSEVDSEERIKRAQAGFATEKETNYSHFTTTSGIKQGLEKEICSAATLFSGNIKNQNKGKKSPISLFCSCNHASQDCIKTQKMTLEERKTKIINRRGCFACLKLTILSVIVKHWINI